MRGLDALNVTYPRIHPDNPYPWMGFYNKPVTVVAYAGRGRD